MDAPGRQQSQNMAYIFTPPPSPGACDHPRTIQTI